MVGVALDPVAFAVVFVPDGAETLAAAVVEVVDTSVPPAPTAEVVVVASREGALSPPPPLAADLGVFPPLLPHAAIASAPATIRALSLPIRFCTAPPVFDASCAVSCTVYNTGRARKPHA
jgi:hypothetical protein